MFPRYTLADDWTSSEVRPPESESEGFPIWLKKCRGEEGSQVGREGGIRGGKSEAGSGFSCLLKHEIVSLSCF